MYECEMSRTIRLHRCQAKTTRFIYYILFPIYAQYVYVPGVDPINKCMSGKTRKVGGCSEVRMLHTGWLYIKVEGI